MAFAARLPLDKPPCLTNTPRPRSFVLQFDHRLLSHWVDLPVLTKIAFSCMAHLDPLISFFSVIKHRPIDVEDIYYNNFHELLLPEYVPSFRDRSATVTISFTAETFQPLASFQKIMTVSPVLRSVCLSEVPIPASNCSAFSANAVDSFDPWKDIATLTLMTETFVQYQQHLVLKLLHADLQHAIRHRAHIRFYDSLWVKMMTPYAGSATDPLSPQPDPHTVIVNTPITTTTDNVLQETVHYPMVLPPLLQPPTASDHGIDLFPEPVVTPVIRPPPDPDPSMFFFLSSMLIPLALPPPAPDPKASFLRLVNP